MNATNEINRKIFEAQSFSGRTPLAIYLGKAEWGALREHSMALTTLSRAANPEEPDTYRGIPVHHVNDVSHLYVRPDLGLYGEFGA